MMSDLELIPAVTGSPDQQTQARRQLTCTAMPTRISEQWQAATFRLPPQRPGPTGGLPG